MIDVFYKPDRFFEGVGRDVSRPIAVMALVGVAATLAQVLPATHMTSQLARSSAVRTVGMAFAGFLGFVMPFVIWGLVAGAGHVLSINWGGTGRFKETAAYTAWGFVPLIPGYALVAVFRYLAVQQVDPPTSVDGLRLASQEVTRIPLYRVGAVVLVVLLLWSAFIWAVGVKEARGVTLRQAAVSIGVPVLIVLAYQLSKLL